MEELFSNTVWSYSSDQTKTAVMLEDENTKEIESFINLSDGWNFGRGNVPLSRVIEKAKRLYWKSKIHGFSQIEPYANEDGTVSLLIIIGQYSLDIRISEDPRLILRYEKGKGSDYDVIYDGKTILEAELISTLSEIRSKWMNASSLGLSNTKIIAAETNVSDIKKYLSPTKTEFQFF